MEKEYVLVFDEVIIKQLQEAGKNNSIRSILKKMLDKLELIGPFAGKLLDPRIQLYEIKNKKPPLRLYFKHNKTTNEIYVFEFEMKTSEKKQKKTISKIKHKTRSLES